MARARNIKPGFFKNEDLIELPFEYRLLFIGLWTLADRDGKLEDRPKRIKMEIFPADNVDVEEGLSELERHGFVDRYEVHGKRIVLISKFTVHQSPHHTEKGSDLPNKDGSMTVAQPKRRASKEDGAPKVNGEDTVTTPKQDGGNPPDSLIHRFTDSLNPDSQKPLPAAASTPPPESHEAAPDAPPSHVQGQKPETRFALLIRQWEKARGKAPKVTSSDPRLSVWAEKGVTADQLQEAYELAVADRDKAGDPGPINAGFLDTFLAKVLNPRGGDSALNRPGATGAAKPWQLSWSGIEAKAEELGIRQAEGEHPQVFKARVFAAAGVTDEDRARLRADFGVAV